MDLTGAQMDELSSCIDGTPEGELAIRDRYIEMLEEEVLLWNEHECN